MSAIAVVVGADSAYVTIENVLVAVFECASVAVTVTVVAVEAALGVPNIVLETESIFNHDGFPEIVNVGVSP